MQHLGDTRSLALADQFAGVLWARGMPAMAEAGAAGIGRIYIEQPAHKAQAEELLAELNSQAATEPTLMAAMAEEAARGRELRGQAQRAQAAAARPGSRAQVVDVRQGWNESAVLARGMLTVLLVAVAGLVFFLQSMQEEGEKYAAIEKLFFFADGTEGWARGFSPWRDIAAGEVWRLFTPVLLHFTITHVLFNCLWILDLGSRIERREGSFALAFWVVLFGIGSNVVHVLWAGAPFFGGLSGVVYGLFGYVWLRGKREPALRSYEMTKQEVVLGFVWLVLCMTGAMGPIANGAHVGGIGLGLAAAYVAPLVGRVMGARP